MWLDELDLLEEPREIRIRMSRGAGGRFAHDNLSEHRVVTFIEEATIPGPRRRNAPQHIDHERCVQDESGHVVPESVSSDRSLRTQFATPSGSSHSLGPFPFQA